jgi:hypothetical protein
MGATGGIATPVVSPAAAVTIFGLWRWGNMGWGIVVEENDHCWQRRRCQSCDELLARFPQLQKLIVNSKDTKN